MKSEFSVNSGILAIVIFALTAALVIVGTVYPGHAVQAVAGAAPRITAASSPQAAVENLVGQIGRNEWNAAYASLANKSSFSENEFIRDLTGSYGSLRSYATLAGFELSPLRASSDDAVVRTSLRWSTIVDTFRDVRDLKVVRSGSIWQVEWPIVKEPHATPQVIPVNYLRWDVVYPGGAEDWGAQDVEAPHVRIVDMHPSDRASGGTVILGELLNEDAVPAYVTVKATLLAKNGSAIASEDAFDKMSHVLLPQQVTPFRIDFPRVHLAQVDSVRMEPSSDLVPASADPVVQIENQQLHPLPDPSLTGDLLNQSGQTVGIAHVIATFYDKGGQLVWVSDGYADRSLAPQNPVPFSVSYPADLAGRIVNYRVTTSTYSANRMQ